MRCAGVVRAAVKLLESGSYALLVHEQSARALKNLAMNDVLRDEIVLRYGVEALVAACEVRISGVLQEQAARALGNIAMSDVNEERIVATGGVEALVRLLRSSNEPLLDASLGALSNLVSNSHVRWRMVMAGGVQVRSENNYSPTRMNCHRL